MSDGTKKKSRKFGLLDIIIVVAVLVFAGSAFMFGKEYFQNRRDKAAFDKMSGALQAATALQGEEKSPEELALEYYTTLKEQNSDFVGWISIPDTPLDYPVMHTPDDPEYYLRRAFDGSYSVAGTPFIGKGCSVNSTNVLIYGHRMNNDTMFTTLLDYARKEYWQQHPQVRFDTVDSINRYDIVAAFYIDLPMADDPDAFHWYNYGGDIEGEMYAEFVQGVMEHAYYDTGIEIKEGDKLITLTTCAYNSDEQRFVVVAKLAD